MIGIALTVTVIVSVSVLVGWRADSEPSRRMSPEFVTTSLSQADEKAEVDEKALSVKTTPPSVKTPSLSFAPDTKKKPVITDAVKKVEEPAAITLSELKNNDKGPANNYWNKIKALGTAGRTMSDETMEELYEYFESGPVSSSLDLHVMDVILIRMENQNRDLSQHVARLWI